VSRKWLLTMLVVAMLAVAACGGGDDSKPESASGPSAQEAIAATLEIAMGDLYFGATPDNLQNPPVWTVNAGDNVQLNLKNSGGLQHNWAIVKQGSEVPVPYMDDKDSGIILWQAGLVDPGADKSETLTAPAAGEYTVICTVAGHYPSMQGKLVVK
jgi:uncharacterized cupredoxin-like copper-binding protein